MKLDLVLDKGFYRLATLVVLMVGLLTTSVTAMREWSQQQELANFQLLSQRYAALADEKLVQVEAELQRSSASKALPKNSDLLQERMPWVLHVQERDSKSSVIFESTPITGSPNTEVLALSLIEGARSLGRLHFGDLQVSPAGEAIVYAAWPISGADSYGLACLSISKLLQSINSTSSATLGIEASWENKPNSLLENPRFQEIRLSNSGLILPVRISTTDSFATKSTWQIYGLPLLALLLTFALALYVREIILRQRAEAITREQQERVQINSRFATLGEISAMISHEINQPLAAIEMYASTCEKLLKSGASKPETMQQALTGVRSQTERVSRIIRSVQDFAQSRSETPQGLDVMAVIRDLAPLIEIQAKRLKAIVKVQGVTGVHIVADKTMMEQVILNLVRNGLEAMRNTPEDRRLLTIEVLKNDTSLNLRITDQGSGIAPELRDRIFSAFVTNKHKGTGVGLSLCKSLVEKHRGRISFADNPNGGTIFTVELPIELSKSTEVSPLKNAVEVAL